MSNSSVTVRLFREHYISKGYARGKLNPEEITILAPQDISDEDLADALATFALFKLAPPHVLSYSKDAQKT